MEDFLEEVYMDQSDYETLVALLRNKKNIILQGAPGVGKTFAAKRLAHSIRTPSNYAKLQNAMPLEAFAIFYTTAYSILPSIAGGMSLSISETAASEPLRHL